VNSLAELCLAILVLLVTPGPTNTLLFLAGSERGWRGALRLIPAELLGYLATVLPLTLIGAAVLQSHPQARPAIALLAGVWVAWLALKLWQTGRSRTATPDLAQVTARMVFVTTLLNPKALIFGLVLLPSPGQLPLNFAIFIAQVTVVAAAWASFGAVLTATTQQNPRSLPLIRRIASVWLGIVSLTLIAKSLGA
jgi:threonine/homoserine/homoserine lactone efflux protein